MAKTPTKLPGKPRGKPNPNIATAGAKTRFGQPGAPDARKSGKKGGEANSFSFSVREQLRYVMAQPISSDMDSLDRELKRLRKTERLKDGETTLARLFATRLLERAVKKAEPQMAQVIMENMEGKLSQEIEIKQPAQLANPDTIKPEDAEAAYKKFMAQ